MDQSHPATGPVGIFDAGLGAYAVVRALRAQAPDADVVYLADRASFPYGAKSRAELATVVTAGAHELQRRGCAAVVVASNAPSVTVLPEVQAAVQVPVFGVLPPVREALERVRGTVVVLGAASLTGSRELAAYLDEQAGGETKQQRDRVVAAPATELIELVETAAFIDEPERTQTEVSAFVARVRAQWPEVAALTLSSTHLPWLRPFVARAAPDLVLLDPADSAVRAVLPLVSRGGSLRCLVTEQPGLSAADFSTALGRITAAAGEPPITPVRIEPLT